MIKYYEFNGTELVHVHKRDVTDEKARNGLYVPCTGGLGCLHFWKYVGADTLPDEPTIRARIEAEVPHL